MTAEKLKALNDSLGELSRASRAWQLTVQLRLGKDAD